MQRAVLRSGAVQAVRRDRFISWDRFKEALFSPRASRRPANGVYRSLFTTRLLREDAQKGPLFAELLGAGNAGRSARFRGYLNTILPSLGQLVKALDEAEAAFPAPLAGDFRLLYRRYNDFLEEHGLYEPSFEEPRRGEETELEYTIFYPELLEDFREYASLLEQHPQVRVYPMCDAQGELPGELDVRLTRYDNAAEELTGLLDRVERLLEEGIAPQEIAITLPDFDGWRGRLEEAAAIRDLPLSFRSGRPLAELAAGRFFRRLRDLHRSGWEHARLKELFLDPAYPWREREALRRIVDFGVRYHCVRAYEGAEERYDPWQSKLDSPAGKEIPEEGRLLNRFRSYLRSFTESRSAEELLGRVTPFLRLFLDPEGWAEPEERALQYALLKLRELAEAETHCGLSAPDPFALWLALLEEQSYVHADRSTAIPVYRYRVSAGTAFRHHFIAGAGQQQTRCRHIPFPYLREDRRGRLARAEERDASEAFLRAYACSGERVYFSCSDAGFDGPQLPPAEFYTRGLIDPAEGRPQPGGARLAGECRFWAGEGRLPARLYRMQREGFARMLAAGFEEKGQDYTRERVEDPELRSTLLGSMRRDDDSEGTLWFSPTRLEQFKGCPFIFLVEKGLALEEIEREPRFVDMRVLGILYHRIFARLLQRIQVSDGAFLNGQQERYTAWAEEIVEEQFRRAESRGEAFLPPVWRRERTRALEKLRRYIEEEAQAFTGYRLDGSEESYHAVIPDSGVGFTGRIDRHSSLGEATAVIDYKSGKLPEKGEVAPKGVEPPIVQLPVYVYLLERAGREVHSASYYGVKENRYRHVYSEEPEHGKAWMDREYLDEAIASICETAIAAAQRIGAGDLQVPEECEPCAYRGLCRHKFRVAGSSAGGRRAGSEEDRDAR
jgi:RecB family exonuclease